MKRKFSIKPLTLLFIICFCSVALLYFSSESSDGEVSSDNAQVKLLLNQSIKPFKLVTEDQPVLLPRDFALDPRFQQGWWHFFANVSDAKGTKYGIQWSFFRISSEHQELNGWQNSQLLLSHIVVSSQNQVWHEQRIARGGIGQAGVNSHPFKVWIDNWSWESLGATPFPGVLDVETDSLKLSLQSTALGPFVLPGKRGYVSKNASNQLASYNLSAPFIDVSGELSLDGGPSFHIDGEAWMSKEWGSGLLGDEQQGWDWFVFHLDPQNTLSIRQYRDQNAGHHVVATLSTNSGKTISIDEKDITIEPLQTSFLQGDKAIPLHWSIDIPKHNIHLKVSPNNTNLWLPFVMPYWEGPVTTQGSHVSEGFMQLAGY